jgi:hypothetical protein
MAHRPAWRLHLDLGAWRIEFLHWRGLRSSWCNTNVHDHGQEADQVRSASALPNHRCRCRYNASDGNDTVDPQSCKHSDNPTGRLPSRYGRAAGPVHLELPGDVAREEIEPKATLFTPVHTIELPVAPPSALDRAAETILAATRPLIMIGAEGSRPRLVNALSSLSSALG